MNLYKKLATLTVSNVSLGADHFGGGNDEADNRILDAYVDFGGNFIDTANLYGRWLPHGENASEQFLGRWLKSRKKSLVIATKGGHHDLYDPSHKRLGEADVRWDLESSLKTLGLDTIDFYWLHRDDPSIPIGMILEMLEGFVKEGKIRHYGASNYSAARLAEAEAYAKAHGLQGFTAVSNQHSVAKVNRGANTNPDPTLVIVGEEDLAFHRRSKTPLIPYQSTARGYFAKLASGAEISPALAAAYENEENRRRYEALLRETEEKGYSMQTASLVALTREEFPVIPITSVGSVERLKDVFDAMIAIGEE
jgi:aryl-alcohol dehydrogenase-like predicted oxidoreductase